MKEVGDPSQRRQYAAGETAKLPVCLWCPNGSLECSAVLLSTSLALSRSIPYRNLLVGGLTGKAVEAVHSRMLFFGLPSSHS